MSEIYLDVVQRSHHFTVKVVAARGQQPVDSLCRKLVEWGFEKENGQYIRRPLRVYATKVKHTNTYRFHINHYKDFIAYYKANGIHDDNVRVSVEIPNPGVAVNLPIRKKWSLREHQVPIVEYFKQSYPISKFLGMQTGGGKGICSMYAASHYGKRIVVIVKAMYVNKWYKEYLDVCEIRPKDILRINGADQLRDLIDAAVSGKLKAKIIIISNRTMLLWLKSYENNGPLLTELGYKCTPEDFFEVLGAGQRVIDEVHQDFHFNFKLDLYTHVAQSISLSATLTNQDSFISGMYETAYPTAERCKVAAYEKYVAITAVIYRAWKPDKLRTTEWGSTTYSHTAFEKSIIRHVPTLNNYLNMVLHIVRNAFLADRKPNHKLLIFCATIDMCTRLTQHLSNHYPSMVIRRYVEEDPDEHLYESEIIVSTLISSGTAKDIENLYMVLQTTAVKSEQANLQSIGRLRKLKDGTTPRFLYLSCQDLPKHMEYHQLKRWLLEPKTIAFREEHISKPI